MKVTIGILTYNSDATIEFALESISKQTALHSVESVLIIDNGSTDNTLSKVQSPKWANLPIQVFRSGCNNLAYARNQILSHCKTELLLFLDSDGVLSSSWIERAILLLTDDMSCRSHQVAGVSGPSHFEAIDKKWVYYALKTMSHSFLGNFGSVQALLKTETREVDHLPCTASLWKADLLRQSKGFDLDFADAGEDLELGSRLRFLSHKLIFSEDLEHRHLLEDQSLVAWVKRVFKFGRAQVFVFSKWPIYFPLYKIILPHLYLLALISAFILLSKAVFWGSLLSIIYFQILFLQCLKYQSDLRHAFKGTVLMALTHFAYAVGQFSAWPTVLLRLAKNQKRPRFVSEK
ncbi:MAG: glycosyltransferase family 2 protein [Pseudobdellovibrionaceae bacterium]